MPPKLYRVCNTCGETKHRSEFKQYGKKSGGFSYSSKCLVCLEIWKGGGRVCRKCGERKPLTEFEKMPGGCRNKACYACREQMPAKRRRRAGRFSGCEQCEFLDQCKLIIKRMDPELDPYCFASSRLHGAFVKVYGRVQL